MKKLFIIILLLASMNCFAEVKTFLPKQNQALPDNYGVKIIYVTGLTETFELSSHRLQNGLFEFEIKDDLWNWVPVENVLRIEFDKRFSQIMAIKEKESAGQATPQEPKVLPTPDMSQPPAMQLLNQGEQK
jgi:hypothetical protein